MQAGGEGQGRVSQEVSRELGAETPEAGRPPWWSRESLCWKSPEAGTGRNLEGQNVQEWGLRWEGGEAARCPPPPKDGEEFRL